MLQMKSINHETTNRFAAFALRGGRLRKRGRGVISYAPFLTGMVSVVVLGSMFALSTSSFANADEVERNKTKIYTNVTTVYTDKFKSNPSNSRSSFEYEFVNFTRNITTVLDTTVTTSGSVSRVGTGVYVYRSGKGIMEVNNSANINDAYYGIEASHTGEDDLIITNSGRLTGIEYDGIFATRAGEGAINVSSAATGEIVVGNWGIHAGHIGTGGIVIDNFSRITSEDTGIHARHRGGGDISVTSSSQIDADEFGIYARHRGTTGNIGVTSSSKIISDDVGIYAKQVTGGRLHIVAQESSEIVSSGKGIAAYQEGNGVIDIDVASGASITSTGKYGIFAQHSGNYATSTDANGDSTYSVHLDIKGAVKGHKKGILVKHSGTGDIVI